MTTKMEDLTENPTTAVVTEPEVTIGKKRKRSPSSHDDEDQPAVKYLELAEVFTLNNFSDEVLFEIFMYLDSFSLLSLEKTCTRFFGLVQDHRLWTNIDLLEKNQTIAELKSTLNRANKRTKSIKINGVLSPTSRNNPKIERECLMNFLVPKCENLSDLELQNVFIDFFAIKIQDFPKHLKRLVFRDVFVRWPDNAPTVFQKMDRSLVSLEELCVESCTWFHPYDIMLFSKCPNLKRLSMRGCQNLSDFVPYGSMASRFGFKALEYLDVRDTPITDSDLQCFNAILTLKELQLQCPHYLRVNKPLPSKGSTSTAGPSSSSSSQESADVVNLVDAPEAEEEEDEADDCEPGTSHQHRNDLANVMMTIDLHNHTRTVILHGRVCEIPESEFRRIPHPDHPTGQFGSLLRHPHFWDMIDRQTGPDCGPCVATKPQVCPITNRGISCFGRPANPIDQNVIWIRIGHRPSDNTFERLTLRHYRKITDDTLKHLVQCSPKLVFLDVSGTGVTQKGVDEFRAKKPGCTLVCEHLDNC